MKKISKIVLETFLFKRLEIFSCQWVHGFNGPVFWVILQTFTAELSKVLTFIGKFAMKWFWDLYAAYPFVDSKSKIKNWSHFNSSVAFHIETRCIANQMTGFCIKWNTGVEIKRNTRKNKSCKNELFYHFRCFLSYYLDLFFSCQLK